MGVYRKAIGLGVVIGLAFSHPAAAFDKPGYQSLIEAVAREVVVGKFENFGATLKRLDEAVAIATVGAKERAAAVPADAKLMQFSISAPEAIKKTAVDRLDLDWGDGGKAFERAGFKRGAGDQFKAAESYSDLLVHPTTAWVYLSAWKADPRPILLELAKNELIEVLEHLKHAK
ncbi:MAG: hypothetical protein ACOVVK_23250 [Elsteraceae bacterium]